jgi:hypothetical protein
MKKFLFLFAALGIAFTSFFAQQVYAQNDIVISGDGTPLSIVKNVQTIGDPGITV